MSDEFFRTKMGHKFYEADVPRIARALEDIAKKLSSKQEPPTPQEVYVVVYTHQHGTDFGVYHDHEAAEYGVWELMNEYMSEFREKASKDQEARLKATTSPKDLGEAMTVWHEVTEEEFEICKRDVE